jgi:hypothetical protein
MRFGNAKIGEQEGGCLGFHRGAAIGMQDELARCHWMLGTLRHGMSYVDPGATYYEERYRQRVLGNLQRRAKSLGYVLYQADRDPTQVVVS